LDGWRTACGDKEVDAELIGHAGTGRVADGATADPRTLRPHYARSRSSWPNRSVTRGAPAGAVEQVTNPQFLNRMKSDADFERNHGLIEMAKRNLKKLSDAGVKIGFGTDTGQRGASRDSSSTWNWS